MSNEKQQDKKHASSASTEDREVVSAPAGEQDSSSAAVSEQNNNFSSTFDEADQDLEKTELVATRLQNRDYLDRMNTPHDDKINKQEDLSEATPQTEQSARSKKQEGLRNVVVLGLAVAIVLAVIAISSIRATDKPTVTQVSSDIANLSTAPTYHPGDFGRTTTLSLDSVDYSEVVRNEDHCNAKGALVYAGDGIAAREDVSLIYTRQGQGKWKVSGKLVVNKLTWIATKGPDAKKVLEQASVFLQRADLEERAAQKDSELDDMAEGSQSSTSTPQTQSQTKSPGAPAQQAPSAEAPEPESLFALYRDAKSSLLQEELNADTNDATVVLAFSSKTKFSQRMCHLTIKFHLSSQTGTWEIKSCTADKNARKTSYVPLVGTWKGTYQSQKNDGHACYGASSQPLTLTIGSTQTDEDNVTQVTGTFSGLVHHHGSVPKDVNSSEGDVRQDNISFTATLSESSDGALKLNYTTPKSAEGTIELTLSFGGDKTPEKATATLTTHYKNEQNFLVIPYTVTAEFADNYLLSKKESN